jgi:hypothetical protein
MADQKGWRTSRSVLEARRRRTAPPQARERNNRPVSRSCPHSRRPGVDAVQVLSPMNRGAPVAAYFFRVNLNSAGFELPELVHASSW